MLSIISFGQRLGMEGGTVSVSECLSPPLLFFRAKLSFITLKSQGQGPPSERFSLLKVLIWSLFRNFWVLNKKVYVIHFTLIVHIVLGEGPYFYLGP